MDYLILISLVVAGLLLFLAEVFILPGLTVAGVVSIGCLIGAICYGFLHFGMYYGFLAMIFVIACYVLTFIWLVRTKSLDKVTLKKEIESTIDAPAEEKVQVGDTGIAITRLALIGNADINGRLMEVKSADGFLNEGTPIVVDRIFEGIIWVKRQ